MRTVRKVASAAAAVSLALSSITLRRAAPILPLALPALAAPSADAPNPSDPVDITPQQCTLRLQLLATIVSPDDGIRSYGVIRDLADEKRRVGIYRRGNALPQNATLVQVVPRRVYLLVDNHIQYLDLDLVGAPVAAPPTRALAGAPPSDDPLDAEVARGIRCSGNSCVIDKSLIDKILQNTTALATSARFVPSIKDGKPNGFKVYAIRPGSIFAKLGMKNADLVRAINGLDMSTPDRALEAYTKLKSASHLTMLLERRGENITLDYQIR